MLNEASAKQLVTSSFGVAAILNLIAAIVEVDAGWFFALRVLTSVVFTIAVVVWLVLVLRARSKRRP